MSSRNSSRYIQKRLESALNYVFTYVFGIVGFIAALAQILQILIDNPGGYAGKIILALILVILGAVLVFIIVKNFKSKHIAVIISSLIIILIVSFLNIFIMWNSGTGLLNLFIAGFVIFWCIIISCYLIRCYLIRCFQERLVIPLLIAVIVLIVCNAYPIYVYNQRTDDFIVLVADFDNGTLPDPDDYKVKDLIVDEIRKSTRRFQGISVRAINDTIRDRSEAKLVAKKYKGSVIIWGSYRVRDKVLISVNFEITCPLKCPPRLADSVSGENMFVSRDRFEEFELQQDLSKKMAFLSLFISGIASYENKSYREADERLTEALRLSAKQDPDAILDRFSTYWYRGIVRYYREDYEGSIADFTKSLEISPSYQGYLWRGFVLAEVKRYKEAIADYDLAIDMNPKGRSAFENRGGAYYEIGDFQRALSDANTAINLDSSRCHVYFLRGRVNFAIGERGKAIEDLSKAISLCSEDSLVWSMLNWRGFVYANMGDYAKAIADYNKALNLNPDSVDVYYNRGLAYNKTGKYDLAIKDFSRVLDIDPNYKNAMNYRDIAIYSRDIKSDPQNYLLYLSRGISHERVKSWDEAYIDYDIAISLNRQFAPAYAGRGTALYNRSEYTAAIADYSRALEIDKKLAYVHRNRGLCYKQLGKYDLALYDFTEAINKDPKLVVAYVDRGDTYILLRKPEKAYQEYIQALNLTDDDALKQSIAEKIATLSMSLVP